MRFAPLVLLLSCSPSGALLAQQPRSRPAEGAQPTGVAPILSATFARARASGALKRVLGERFFRDARGGLVSVRCTLDDARRPSELRLVVELRAVGAMREETLELTSAYGLEDGALRRSGFVLVRGRDRVEASGPLRRAEDGERLELRVREARGEHSSQREVAVPWARDAIPFGLAVFVLPLLADQGLPAELRFRAYHPVSMALNPDPSTARAGKGELTLSGFVPGQAKPTVARVREGALVEVLLGEHDRLVPISAREAAQLRGE